MIKSRGIRQAVAQMEELRNDTKFLSENLTGRTTWKN
jgi:hypothetical protein